MTPRIRAFLGLAALVAVGSCVSSDSSTGIDDQLVPGGVAVQPAIIESAADETALPINRIRAVTASSPSNLVLGDTTFAVDPNASEWDITLDVSLTQSPTEARVFLYLMNQEGAGPAAVQYSGRTEPIQIARGETSEPADIPLVRGPLANLFVTDLGISLAGCDAPSATDGVGGVDGGDPASVCQATAPLIVGESLALSADLTSSSSSSAAPRVFWTSLDTSLIRVDSATAVGLAPGLASIVASAGFLADTVEIEVIIPPVDSIAVVPDSADVIIGQTRTFTAELFDFRDRPLTGREVRWSVADTVIAVVDSLTGVVTTRALGSTTLTATSEGVSGSGTVVVVPVPVDSVLVSPDTAEVRVGQATTYTFETFDSIGGTLTGRTATWATANTAVATVDANGVVTGAGPGITTVTATSEGVSDDAVIIVSLVPVDSVRAIPDSAEVRVGGTFTFTAETYDSTGVLLTGRSVEWASSDVAVAVIDESTGEVSGIGAGTAVITATSEGVIDDAVVTVSLVPVDSVVVTPLTAQIEAGQTEQFSVVLFDSLGAPATGRAIAWSSSDDAVATVDASGLATGLSDGVATITATSEGVSAFGTLTVSSPPPNLSRWIAAAGGNWSDGANWSKGIPPEVGDSVVIDGIDGIVVLDTGADIAFLELSGAAGQTVTLQHAGPTLTVSDLVLTNQFTTYALLSGVLDGDHAATFGGSFDFDGGQYGGAGTSTLGSGAAHSWQGGGTRTLNGRTIINEGELVWSAGNIIPTAGGTLVNGPTGTWTIAGDVQFGESAATTLRNEGTLVRATATGQATIFAAFDNEGTLEVQTGSLVLAGDGTHPGAFVAGAGALLNFTSVSDHTITGPISGAGAVNFGTGTNVVQGDFSAAGLSFNGGSTSLVSLQGGFPATLDSIVKFGSGELQISGADTVRASLVKVTSGFFTGTSVRIATDSLEITGGTMLGGEVALAAGAAGAIGGTAHTFDGTTLRLDGDAVWQSGDMEFTDADVIVGATGSLSVEASVQLSTLGSGAGLDVQGALSVPGGLTTDAAVEVSGALDLTDGGLDVDGTFSLFPGAIVTGNDILDIEDATATDLSGDFAPGAPETATVDVIDADAALGSTSSIQIDIGGYGEGSERDMVRFSEAVALDGALVVDFTNGFVPTAGDEFPVVTFTSRTGSFNSVTLPTVAGLVVDTATVSPGQGPDELRVVVRPPSPFEMVGFDAARGGIFSLTDGSELDNLRLVLETEYPGLVPTGVPTLTPAALSGADLLFIASPQVGSTGVTPLSAAEQSALLDFVRLGGCAVLLVDNSDFAAANASFLTPFGMAAAGQLLGGLQTTTNFAAEASPITNGPQGVVPLYSQADPGAITSVGPDGYAFATNPLGTAAAVIPSGVLDVGSGPVIVYADAGWVQDPGSGGGFGLTENQNLLLNTIEACFGFVGAPGVPGTQTVWTGEAGTSFSAAGSWSNGSPTPTTNAFVWAGAAAQPSLIGSTATADLVLEAGATVTIPTSQTLTVDGDLDNAGAIVGAGTLLKTGAGTTVNGAISNLRTTDSITVSGPMTVSGNLRPSGPGSGGTDVLNLDGNLVTVGGDLTVGTAGAGGVRFAGGDTLDVAGDATFDGGAAGDRYTSGTLIVEGDLTDLTGGHYDPSGTHRTVFVGNGDSRDLVVNAPSTLQDVTFEAVDGEYVLATDIVIDGGLDVVEGFITFDGNTLTVNGALDFGDAGLLTSSGTLDLSAGTVTTFEGDARPGGTAAGAIDVIAPAAGLTQESLSNFFLDLGGTTPETEYDQLRVTGDVTLSGDLIVDTIGGHVPAGGNRYAVLTATSITGGFSNLTLPTLPGLTFDTLTATTGSVDTLYVVVAGTGTPLTQWIPGGGASDAWSDPGNWSGGVPAPGDSAVIDAAGAYTVTLDTSADLDHLVIGGPGATVNFDHLSNTTLTVNQTMQVAAGSSYEMGLSAELAGAHEGTFDGDLILSDVWSLTGDGTTTLNSTGNVMNQGGTSSERDIVLNGTLTTTNGAGPNWTQSNASIFTIASGGVWAIDGSMSMLGFTGAAVVNEGTITRATGTLTMRLATGFTNDGLVDVQSGPLRLDVDATHTGDFSVAPGATLRVADGNIHTFQGSVTGGGTVEWPSPVGGTTTFTGDLGVGGLVSSGTTDVLVSGTLSQPLDSIRWTGSGTLTLDASTSLVTSRLEQSAGTVTGPDTLFVTDEWWWAGGTQAGPGVTVVQSGVTAGDWNAGAKVISGRTIANEGTISWAAGDVTIESSGALENTGTLTADAAAGVQLLPGGGGGLGITNGGLLEVDGLGLLLAVPATNDGTIDVADGATVDFDADADHNDGAVIRGSGTVDVEDVVTGALAGDIVPGGVGTIDTLTWIGDYDPTATSRILVELSSAGADLLVIEGQTDGSLTFGGALLVDTIPGFVAQAGDTIEIVEYLTRSQGFQSITLPTFAGVDYLVDFTPDAGGLGDTDFVRLIGVAQGSGLTIGSTVSADIAAPAETDSYTFFGNAGDVITVAFAGEGAFNAFARAELYNPSAGILGAVNPTIDANPEFTLLETGEHRLDIFASDGTATGTYGVTVEGVSTPSPDAAALTLGTEIQGTIGATAEVDEYTFTGAVDDVVQLSLGEVTSFADLVQAYLFSPSGVPLGGVNEGLASQFTLTEAGTHVVQVHSSSALGTGDYAVNVEGIAPPSANATALTIGTPNAGTIANPGEVDTYTFTGAVNDVLTISLGGEAGFSTDARARLVAPSGALVGIVDPNLDSDPEFTLAEAGMHVLSVSGVGFTPTGAYGVSVEGVSTPSPDAIALTIGTEIQGTIGATAEVDEYTFTGAADDVVQLSLGEVTPFGGQAYLFSPSGAALGGVNGGLASLITLTEPGTHVVQVHSSSALGTGNYAVNVEGIAPPSATAEAITHADTLPRTIGAAGDVDLFTFDATSGANLLLDLELVSGFGGSSLAGLVYDPTGTQVATITAGVQLDLSPAVTGTHVIVVRAAGFVATGSYALSLIDPSVPPPNLNQWVGTTGGGDGTLWTDPLNWSKGAIPIASDSVVIDDPAATVTLTALSPTVDYLFVGGAGGSPTFTHAGGNLTVNDSFAVAVDGVYELAGGNLTGAAAAAIDGTFRWTQGFLAGTGAATVTGPVEITGPGNKRVQRRVELESVALWDEGQLAVANGDTLVITPTGALQIDGDLTFAGFGSTGVVINNGLVEKTSGAGTAALEVFEFINNDSVHVASGTFSLDGAATTHAGAFWIEPAAALGIDGGLMDFDGDVRGGGRVLFRAGGSARFDGALEIPDITLTTGTNWFFNSDTTYVPLIDMSGGATQLRGSGAIVVTDSLHWAGGILLHSGTFSFASDTVRAAITGSATKRVQGLTEFDGLTVWNEGVLSLANGDTLTIPPTGTFRIDGDLTFGGFGSSAALINNGLIEKTGGTGTTPLEVFQFINNDSVHVAAGTLSLDGATAAHAGAFTVDPGAVLSLDGGVHTFNAPVGGGGRVLFNAGAGGTFNDTLDVPDITITSGSNWFFNADTTAVPLISLSGTGWVRGAGQILVTDSLYWGGGRIAPTGTTGRFGFAADTVNAYITGTPNKLVESRVDLDGLTVWDQGEIQIIAGDTLAIAPTGTLRMVGDLTMGAFGATSVLLNEGLFEKTAGAGTGTLATLRATNTATGTIDVEAGTLQIAGIYQGDDGSTLQGSGTLDLPATLDPTSLQSDLRPGDSPGALSLQRTALTLSPLGLVDIELGGTTLGTGYDLLSFTGDVTFAGALVVDTIDGFEPSPGDTFTILTMDSRTGDFDSVTLPTIAGVTLDTLWADGATRDTLFVVATGSGGGPQQLATWAAGTSGTWSEPDNWTGNQVPQPGDSVVIDAAGTYTVTIDTDVDVSNLIVAGGPADDITIAHAANTVTVTDTMIVGESVLYELSGTATLTGAGDVVVSEGTLDWFGGTLAGPAALYIEPLGGVWINGSAAKTLDTRDLVVDGSLLWSDDGEVTHSGAPLLDIGVGAEFTIDADGSFSGAPRAFIQNDGIIRASGTGTAALINFELVSTDSVIAESGALTFADLGGTSSSTGAFHAADGAYLGIPSGTVEATGSVGGEGTIALSDGAADLLVEADIDVDTLTTVGGQTITITGDYVVGTTALASGSVNLIVNSPDTARSDVTILGSTTTLGGSAPFIFLDTLIVFGADLAGTGAAILDLDGFAQVTGTSLLDRPFRAEGTIDLQSGTWDVDDVFFLDTLGFVQGDLATLDLADASVTGWFGDVSPGNGFPGDLEIVTPAGGLAPDPIAITYLDLEGTAPGSEHDLLEFTGDVTLDGELVVDTLNGFVPTPGQSFAAITVAGTVSGAFSSVSLPLLNGVSLDLRWETAGAVDTLYLDAGTPTVLTPTQLCSDFSPSAIVTFDDATIEADAKADVGLAPGDDLTCLAAEGVATVDVFNAGVSSLAGVQNLPNLTSLSVQLGSITDASPVAGLTGLTTLALGGHQISDLTPLAGLTDLTTLTLQVNQISDISPIAGLTNLATLTVRQNQISDLTPLSGLAALDSLDARTNLITDVSPLSGLTNLSGLQLDANSISSVAALSGLTGLTTLQLGNNGISDVSPLAGLTALEVLHLNDNDVASIASLSPLTSLTSLQIGGNSISDISVLSNFTALTSFGASTNQISDLSALAGLTSLEDISLIDNLITDISDLAGLTALTSLVIWDNTISDISALSNLTDLITLRIGFNNITDISALVGLTALQLVELTDNAGLSDITALLTNPGIGSGDTIFLDGTAVACVDVTALRATGAFVGSPCP